MRPLGHASQGRQWEQALEKMQDMNVIVISFFAAISACEAGGQWKRALSLLKQMFDVSAVCNAIRYNAAISACELSGQAVGTGIQKHAGRQHDCDQLSWSHLGMRGGRAMVTNVFVARVQGDAGHRHDA